MKAARIIFSILFLLVLFGCSTTEQLVMKPLYSVTSGEQKDISGTYAFDRLLLYKKVIMSGGEEAVTLERWIAPGGEVGYLLTIRYLGHDWIFMHDLRLKIDDDLYTLAGNPPSRKIISDGVSEFMTVPLSHDLVRALAHAEVFAFQYDTSPIIVPLEGVSAIAAFLGAYPID